MDLTNGMIHHVEKPHTATYPQKSENLEDIEHLEQQINAFLLQGYNISNRKKHDRLNASTLTI